MAWSVQPASWSMHDWREFISPASWTFALSRATYAGNAAHDHKVSKQLTILCGRLPCQPEWPCFESFSARIPSSFLWSLGGEDRISPAAQKGADFAALASLPSPLSLLEPGEHFSCFLTSSPHQGTGETTSPPLCLGTSPPKLTRQLQVFCSLVGNFIWPFQVGQEQILDLLTMKCFYLNSTKEAQWKDCSCWAKALHLLQSS